MSVCLSVCPAQHGQEEAAAASGAMPASQGINLHPPIKLIGKREKEKRGEGETSTQGGERAGDILPQITFPPPPGRRITEGGREGLVTKLR